MKNNGPRQSHIVTLLLKVLLVLLSSVLPSTWELSESNRRSQAQSDLRGNLAPNPSFEEPSPASWHNAGSSVGSLLHFWSYDTAYSGDHSAGIISFENIAQGQWWSDPFSVYQVLPYSFSGWIKADSLSNKAFITLAFYESESKEDLIEESSSSQVTGSSNWIQVTGNAVAPNNARYARILCQLEGQGTVWFDEVEVLPRFLQTHLPLVFRNLSVFCNGGFEDGWACWWSGGELNRRLVESPVHSGQIAFLLGNPGYANGGGVPKGSGRAWQTFSVPHGTSRVSIWYRIYTHDIVWSEGTQRYYDSFEIYMNAVDWAEANRSQSDDPWRKTRCRDELGIPDTNAPGLVFCDGNPSEPSKLGSPKDSGWRSVSLDLSSFQGQNITLYLASFNRTDGWYNTWTYLDDIEVTNEP